MCISALGSFCASHVTLTCCSSYCRLSLDWAPLLINLDQRHIDFILHFLSSAPPPTPTPHSALDATPGSVSSAVNPNTDSDAAACRASTTGGSGMPEQSSSASGCVAAAPTDSRQATYCGPRDTLGAPVCEHEMGASGMGHTSGSDAPAVYAHEMGAPGLGLELDLGMGLGWEMGEESVLWSPELARALEQIEEAMLPFFQAFEVRASAVQLNYRPRTVDMAAVAEGQLAHLVNLVRWKVLC